MRSRTSGTARATAGNARISRSCPLRATRRETQQTTGASPNAWRSRTTASLTPGWNSSVSIPDGSSSMPSFPAERPLERLPGPLRHRRQQGRVTADVAEQPRHQRAGELEPVREPDIRDTELPLDRRTHVPERPRARRTRRRPVSGLRSSSCNRRRTAGVGSIISVSSRITSCGYSRSNASQPAKRDEKMVTVPGGNRRIIWST